MSGDVSPQKIYRQETFKIWPDFGRLQLSTMNISGTDENIQNQTNTLSTPIPPTLGKKFGELWSTNYGGFEAKSYPPKCTVFGDHISAPTTHARK